MHDVLRVLWQAVLSFFFLFLISKLLGKKQVAQLEFTDYVIGISIGSIAAQLAVDPDIPFYHFLIAMGLFCILDLFFTLISRKANFLKSFIKGKPLIIIEDGQLNYKNIKNSKLDIHEVVAQCRKKAFSSLQTLLIVFLKQVETLVFYQNLKNVLLLQKISIYHQKKLVFKKKLLLTERLFLKN